MSCCCSPLGPSGPPAAPSVAAAFFGSGSDGPYAASSGVLTLTRDTYFTTIDLSGTAEIDTAGWKLYSQGRCRQLGNSKIRVRGYDGANATATLGGLAGGPPPAGSTLSGLLSALTGAGTDGRDGVVSDSVINAAAPVNVADGWGAAGGATGISTDGGAGFNGNGPSGGAGAAVVAQHKTREIFVDDLLAFVAGASIAFPQRIRCGGGGRGGGSGQWGDNSGAFGVWRSGSGGGGGGGGGALYCAFAEYETDGTTQAGALSARGGNGGDASDATAGDASALLSGGGQGAAGGGAGVVVLYVGTRIGGPVVGLIDITGGDGGDGGDAVGSYNPPGPPTASGGSGGGGGASGQAFALNLSTGEYALSLWANAVTPPIAVAPADPPNLIGAAGNPATVTRVDF